MASTPSETTADANEEIGLATAREPYPEGKWAQFGLKAWEFTKWFGAMTWETILFLKDCMEMVQDYLSDTYNREVLVYNLVLLLFAFTALGLSAYILLSDIELAYNDPGIFVPPPKQERPDFSKVKYNQWYLDKLAASTVA